MSSTTKKKNKQFDRVKPVIDLSGIPFSGLLMARRIFSVVLIGCGVALLMSYWGALRVVGGVVAVFCIFGLVGVSKEISRRNNEDFKQ